MRTASRFGSSSSSARSTKACHSSRTCSGLSRAVELGAAEPTLRAELLPASLHLFEHRGVDVRRAGPEQLGRDADCLRDCAVGLLAGAAGAGGRLDQPRAHEHANVEVQVPGIHVQAVRELSVRELFTGFAEQLEDA